MSNRVKYVNKNGEERKMDINVIPNNIEKYMAFMLGNRLTFIDSFQFMSTSLDKLIYNLPKEACKYTSEEIKNGEMLSLLKRKGIYPYDYLDSFEKFDETNYPQRMSFLVS